MKYFSEQLGVMAIMLILASSVIPLSVDYSMQTAAVSATQCRQYQNKKCSSICKGKAVTCRPCCECKGMVANKNNTGCNARATGTGTNANTKTNSSTSWTACFFENGPGCAGGGSATSEKTAPAASGGDGGAMGGQAPAAPQGGRDCRSTGCPAGSGRECRWTLFEGYQCIIPPIIIGH